MKCVKNTAFRDTVNGFFSSPGYIFCIFALTVLGNLFSLELPVYLIFTLICLYIFIFGEDLHGLMPLFIAAYITPSVHNNPGRNEAGVFSGASGICILVFAGLIALGLIYYILRHKQDFFLTRRKLLIGMLILAGAYLLGGIGSSAQLTKHIPFALIQGASVILPYWILSGGVRWKQLRKDYLAWICLGAGIALSTEILGIYCSGNVIKDGIINRDFIYTGWGIHNNLGFYLAMMIPSAFYLATQYRRRWLGPVIGFVFFVFVCFTCSRSSILGGGLAYGVCLLSTLYYGKKPRTYAISILVAITVIGIPLLVFHQQIYRLFSDLLQMGMDPSHRDEIYMEGLKLFGEKPIFGNSFFSPGYKPWDWATSDFSSFFPPRWHNTVVQMLASCGIAGLAAYGFHRWQTIRLFFLKRSKETNFIGCMVLVLLLCSLLDCHFFNVGPTLFYSMALAVAEFTPKEET